MYAFIPSHITTHILDPERLYFDDLDKSFRLTFNTYLSCSILFIVIMLTWITAYNLVFLNILKFVYVEYVIELILHGFFCCPSELTSSIFVWF